MSNITSVQGPEGLTQLRKLAQNYPTQETGGGGDLGDIDEDDEVPGVLWWPINHCMIHCALPYY